MTFIVTGNFIENASLLDPQRLAKQRVEAIQILRIIENGGKWQNHPIVNSWRPFINALKYYANCIILEFIRRGGNNNLPLFEISSTILVPWWFTWYRLHQSHRAMLMRKNPFYYQGKFLVETEYCKYGYIWPDKVTYEQRYAPLSIITAPIPKELINPIYCQTILKSGERSGEPCNCLIKKRTYIYCGVHKPK